MNTPTHLLLTLAVLARPGDAPRARALAAGAVLPDVPIFVLYAVATLALGQPSAQIWERTYYEPGWQAAVDAAHSVPLALVLLGVARWRGVAWAGWLAAALLLHSALDLPVHREDAHRHLWPLSGWRFISPVSYWDPAHHGRLVGAVEVALALAACVRLWRPARRRWQRVMLAATVAIYLAGAAVLTRPCLALPWLATLAGGAVDGPPARCAGTDGP